MRPDDVIGACRTAHQRLVTAVAAVTPGQLGAPSLLPGYSRAHVVAHAINKTNAHVWLFGGPPAGEIRHVHPDGYDADRAADARARRSPDELRADLKQAFERLQAAWDALSDPMWGWQGNMMAGPRTMAEIIGHHLRNVEVHHVDLDIGYRPSDWPAVLVDAELQKRLRALPDRADHAHLLAWLLGRAQAPVLVGPW